MTASALAANLRLVRDGHCYDHPDKNLERLDDGWSRCRTCGKRFLLAGSTIRERIPISPYAGSILRSISKWRVVLTSGRHVAIGPDPLGYVTIPPDAAFFEADWERLA